MRLRLLALALAALAAACAPPPPAPPAATEAVDAPTPAGVAIRIGADKAGQVVTVPVGQRVAIELVGVPTAGYVWEAVALPSFLARVGEASGPTTTAQSQPGFAGGNHWEVLVLEVTGRGMGDVRMEQRRPWEASEPPADTFTVTIEAR